MRRAIASIALAGCGVPGGDGADATAARDGADAPVVIGDCTSSGSWRPGRHRLFVQGHSGAPRPDGRYPLLHQHTPVDLCDDRVFVDDTSGDGRWQPGEEPRPLGPEGLVHGEHFLVGIGSFAEFAIELCDDIDGEVAFYIPNYDEPGSRTLHQLLVIHDGSEQVIAQAIDEEAGQSGYNPFVRLASGVDPVAAAGDLLVLRSTNLSGVAFSVMVWYPPSDYESWVLVEVP